MLCIYEFSATPKIQDALMIFIIKTFIIPELHKIQCFLLFADAKLKTVSSVSPKEIEKDQGKPLSKYERNMMIFDWLHTLGR